MRLDEWMREEGVTEEALAAEISVSQGAVNRYRRGLRIPRPEIIKRITAATGGKVTIQDIYAAAEARVA